MRRIEDDLAEIERDMRELGDLLATIRARRAAPATRGGTMSKPKPIEKRAVDWLTGSDTGSSSEAILDHMMGMAAGVDLAARYPRDVADWGRCFRLLELIPEWRERIGEMSRHGPYWTALVSRWRDIESAYRRDMRAGGPADDLIRRLVRALEDRDASVFRLNDIATMRIGPPRVRP